MLHLIAIKDYYCGRVLFAPQTTL